VSARPLIAITGRRLGETDRWPHTRAAVSPRGYVESVTRAGGWPALIDPIGDPRGLLDHFDGLVLSGGPDLDPSAYGQERHAKTYGVDINKHVTSSFIGATWGGDITQQAVIGLIVFVILAALFMAIYFRTWKMSLAAIISLAHDLIITAGVYALTGFEVTPATVIGFLTILGYSLYDTVVVFDKIRENTAELGDESTRTFGEAVNLAVNQTLVRSINTGVVAALPVAAILFIGSFILGADTLRDISLALLTGTLIGTYSTPFVASPLYATLRQGEAAIVKRDKRVRQLRAKSVAA